MVLAFTGLRGHSLVAGSSPPGGQSPGQSATAFMNEVGHLSSGS